MCEVSIKCNMNPFICFFDDSRSPNISMNCQMGREEESEGIKIIKRKDKERNINYIRSGEAYWKRNQYLIDLQSYERGPYSGLIRYSHEKLIDIE